MRASFLSRDISVQNFKCLRSLVFTSVRSQQGPLQASIDERSEELAELAGMLARALE